MYEIATSPPRPLWRCIPMCLAFPLQWRPLGYALLLTVGALSIHLIPFFPRSLALLLVGSTIAVLATRYGFKVMALGSRGIVSAADFPRSLDDEWKNLPWKLLALLVVQGILAGSLALKSPVLGYGLGYLMTLTMPAAAIVLVQSGSFFWALNPAAVWGVIRAVGWSYALLCVIIGLLLAGSAFRAAS